MACRGRQRVESEHGCVRVCVHACARACYLHRHVVNVQAEGDSLVEGQLRLSGAVDVHGLFGLNEAFLMVDARLNHTITDGLDTGQRQG